MLNRPPLPWQEWLLIHAGELLPDGRPRFRIVIVIVARQNGKTEVPVILVPYWMFVEKQPLILGTNTKLEYAKESWSKVVKLVERTEAFNKLRSLRKHGGWKREQPGDTSCTTLEDSRYKIAASNEEGGRSLTINRLIADEIRQQKDFKAWGAAEPACSPWDAQIWALSNAGDDTSVVLNQLRKQALDFIETGEGDPRVGIFEWSAEENASTTDPEALLQANPSVGHIRGHTLEDLVRQGAAAQRAGGEALTTFKTEKMCIRVPRMKPAVDAIAWGESFVPGDLRNLRQRVAMCLDISPDMQHATLCAAALMEDERVRVEVVKTWDSLRAVREELPGLLALAKPRAFGWMPNGPAAALAAKLADRKGVRGWPPAGVTVEEIRSEVAAVCMGFSEMVSALQIVHKNELLLTTHVIGAEKLENKEGLWRFQRTGEGHCDAAYDAAGAVHLARTLPSPIGKPRVRGALNAVK